MTNSKTVDIVIPCLNEADTLPDAFRSIHEQTISPNQIFFVDGGSSDGSLAIAERWSKRLPVSIINNPDQRQAPAMNLALENTESSYLARLDGHSYWNETYLEVLLDELSKNPDLAAAGGVVTPALELSPFQFNAWQAMIHPLSMGGNPYRTASSPQLVESVQAPIYRVLALKEVEGFREDIPWGEDDEIHNRLRESDWKLKILPEAVLYYFPRDNFRSLFRQYKHYGMGRALLSNQQIFPAYRHYILDRALFVWTGILCWNPVGWLLGSILSLAYFTTTPLVSKKRSITDSIRIPCLIILMQLGYWLGWLKKRKFIGR